jgi:hypothetical protein
MRVVVDTNSSRWLNKTKQNTVPREDSTVMRKRTRFGSSPRFWPLITSTTSNTHDTKNRVINTTDSPIIVNSICLLFELVRHPNLLVPCMWNVGYFQSTFHVISLFQVSKELHLRGVDILRAKLVLLVTGERYEG